MIRNRSSSRGACSHETNLARGRPERFAATAWYRADRNITIATGVSTWGPILGTGNLSQGTAANQPAYSATGGPNARGTVTGDGVNDFMTGGVALNAQGTWLVAAKYLAAFSANATLYDGNSTNQNRLFRSGSTGYTMFAGSSLAISGVTPESWHIIVSDWANTASTLYEEQTLRGGPGTSGAGVPGAMTILSIPTGASDWSNASIGELVAFGRNITTSERNRVTNYMRAWNGI
jgi:hypothetical protein